ncbi:MAG TPA: hypothetical protein EYO88_00175 [Alphaproteobacteria bacterium]|nr:hypothetical protein [Alphaproteobacteria bacterium]
MVVGNFSPVKAGARLEAEKVGDFTGASLPAPRRRVVAALAPEDFCLAFRAHTFARPCAFERHLAFQAVAALRMLGRLIFGFPV